MDTVTQSGSQMDFYRDKFGPSQICVCGARDVARDVARQRRTVQDSVLNKHGCEQHGRCQGNSFVDVDGW